MLDAKIDPAVTAVASEIVRWNHKLWWRVNDAWTNRTDDHRFLVQFDEVPARLYAWAVDTGRLAKIHPHPFHRYCSVLAPVWSADRPAVVAEANRYLAQRWAEAEAERLKEQAEKKAKKAEQDAQLAAIATTEAGE